MSPSEPVEEQAFEVNALPPEILSNIFLVLREIRRYKHILPFQVTLSHVCQHWRGIAISTPQLWSTITIFSARSLACANEWLTRSGATPLDVRFDLYEMDFREGVATSWIEEALTHTISNAYRFRSLFIFTYNEVNIYHILYLLEHTEVPMLERLNLCVGHRGRVHEPVPSDIFLPITFAGGSPRLTFLKLDLDQRIPALIGITSLHLNLVGRATLLHFDRLAEILQMPNNLNTLSLRGNVGQHSWSMLNDRPYIQLPKLRNLEFSGRGATAVRFIIFFSIPSLESLRWHAESDGYHWFLESPRFQVGMNNFPALKHLTLVSQTLTPRYLSTLIQVFPNPTHVLCSYSGIPERGFKLLDSGQGWKDLHTLAFQKVHGRQTRYFSRWIKAIILARPNIHKVLVDWDLFSCIKEYLPDVGESTTLDLLNSNTFPDYWWNLMTEHTSECL